MAEGAETTKQAAAGHKVDSPMEVQLQRLARKVWQMYQGLDESQRCLIAIAGIPGSGKTTFANSLGYAVNKLYHEDRHKKFPNAPNNGERGRERKHSGSEHHRHWSDPHSPDIAFVLSMDGYHLTRAQLSAMADPDEAHFRRGAAFTFDADGYLALVEKLRKPIEPTTRTILAPSFDHAIKDPVVDDIAIPRTARVIILEGLYVALSPGSAQSPESRPLSKSWTEACNLMDEIWHISVPIPVATERVAKRNFAAGLSPSLEAAIIRTEKNDMRNGREILANLASDKITETIESIEDEEWKTEKQMPDQGLDTSHSRREAQRLKLERMGSIAEMVDAGAGM